MSSTVLDHQSIGRSRVATQYTESQKFLAYIRALLDSSAEMEAVLQKVAEQADIDLAEGVNLDVIGEIVGISRIIPASIAVRFFGFEGQPGGDVFGEEGALGIGSRFREELEPAERPRASFAPGRARRRPRPRQRPPLAAAARRSQPPLAARRSRSPIRHQLR